MPLALCFARPPRNADQPHTASADHAGRQLPALEPKCFKRTTNSKHKFETYLNLAAYCKLCLFLRSRLIPASFLVEI
jgi:hypothetical protein